KPPKPVPKTGRGQRLYRRVPHRPYEGQQQAGVTLRMQGVPGSSSPLRGAATAGADRPGGAGAGVPHRPYEGQQLLGVVGVAEPGPGSSSPLRGAATVRGGGGGRPGRWFLIAPTRGSNM